VPTAHLSPTSDLAHADHTRASRAHRARHACENCGEYSFKKLVVKPAAARCATT
jgi:hypothetical protein